MIVAHFDGDDIGPVLELILLDNKLDNARAYSQSIAQALEHVRDALEELGAEVVICGGDDLVARWETGTVTDLDIKIIRGSFYEICRRTISVGVGANSHDAAINLRRAKLLGKDRVVSTVVAPK
jgi:minimal CRISPR polymerase-like protein